MFDSIKQFASDDKAQMGGMRLQNVLIALVVAGVVGFVGLQVMSTVIEATNLTTGDPLYNASTEVQAAVDDAWSLVGVTFLVIILGSIIFYLRGVR
jgi:hypothetical protein